MEEDLKELLNLLFIQLYTSKEKKEFKYYELFSKLNRFVIDLPIMRSDYVKDLELARIMTFIEREFSVPMLGINLDEWKKMSNENKFILSVYEKLSCLRSI